MTKIERIRYVDLKLQCGKKLTLKMISEETECDKRTASRILEFMKYRLNSPIEYNYPGEYYEYSIEGYKLFCYQPGRNLA